MPYEEITDLPESVRDNLPNTPRRSTNRHSTMPGISTPIKKSAGAMILVKNLLIELPGAPSNKNMRSETAIGLGKANLCKGDES
jgi:hypothetical protein